MLKPFTVLTPFVKLRTDKISIDNLGFKFHYRATFLLLLICVVLVTSRQYIGEHIRCITGGGVPDNVVNTFCFFTTTFTVVRHYNETLLEQGFIPHPGIGPMHPNEEVKHHAYYQWVPFVLFGQAIMFYLPHFIWRTYEGGRLKGLVHGLQMIALSKHNQKKAEMRFSGNYVLPSKDSVDGRVSIIKDQFYMSKHIRINKRFASRLIFCELLNVCNLALQIYATHVFLGRQFYTLGLEFMKDDFMGSMDVLDFVFPKVTKCDFYKYGPSGSVQKHDALCVMALNIVNEKIFVILWFWYCIMIVATTLSIVWRIVTFCIFSSSQKFNRMVYAAACPGRLNTKELATVTRHLSYPDWVFLYYLAKNMEPFIFQNFLSELAIEFTRRYVDDENARLYQPQQSTSDRSTINKESIDEVDFRRK